MNIFIISSLSAQTITITSPNGGESWKTSTDYGIVWNDDILGSVKIELYKGDVYYSTIADTTQSDGYYLWSVTARLWQRL